MRKISILLVILILVGGFIPLEIKAASYQTRINNSTNGTVSIQPGERFTITVSMTDASDVYGVRSRVSYNSNHFKYIGATNLWTNNPLQVGTHFTLVGASPKNGTFNLVSMTFEATGLSASNSSVISVSEVEVTYNKTQEATGNGSILTVNSVAPKSTNNNLSSLTIGGRSVTNFNADTTTYNLGSTDSSSVSVGATAADSKARVTGTGNVNLSYGANTIKVVVTAESGAQKQYNINISRNDPRSTNNFLESITLSQGSIQFDKNRNNYTVIVDNEVEELTISAIKEDASASLKNATITKQLEVYSNIFEFVVVAENNQQRTYTINVVRRDEDGYAGSLNTNNNLATLTIEGYEIAFDSELLEYQLQVEHPVKELIITVSLEDEKSTLVALDSFELVLGENVFEFVVIAEDETQKKYTLTVFRATNLPPLEISELLERLEEVEADVLNVITSANKQFDADMLNQLKATNKQVAFHVLNQDGNSIGYWLVNSENLESINSFNHGVTLLSRIPESINKALNYANAMVVSFDHDGEFDQPKTFVLNLNNTFDERYALNVYYFNEETSKLQLVHNALEQQDNTLSWQMDHASIYVITPATISTGFDLGFDLPFEINLPIILGILIVLVLSLFGNLLLLLKVKKLQKHLLKRKYEVLKPKEENKITTTQEVESVNQESVKDNKET